MKKFLRWVGLIVGGLALVLVIVAVGLTLTGRSKLNQTIDVPVKSLAITADDPSLARGQHLATVFCADCHGPNMEGTLMFDAPPLAVIPAPNLTGAAEKYTTEELVLGIRHGIDPDGKPLMIMPAESFVHLSEADLAALITYLNTLPAKGQPQPDREIMLVGGVLVGAGVFDAMLPATYLDHNQPFHDMPDIGANVPYGEYLARFCQACHGTNLAGGQPPDPESPPGPNLTPGGALQGWTENDFITTMRTGVKPSGTELRGQFMPWESIGKLEDEELQAIWLYLQSLPPLPTNTE